MSWAEGRQTTVKEDKAYSLLGIFGVHLPLIYGEGEANAFRRLEEEIDRPLATDRNEQFRKEDERNAAIKWASPSDLVGDFHNAIYVLRQEHTGDWFLNSESFRDWKTKPNSVLWLRGSAGCGKTVLCSSIVTDVLNHCRTRPGSYIAYFYFSFSDIRRQSAESLFRMIVRQLLLQRDTILADFRDIWKRFMHSNPPIEAWIEVLQALSRQSGHIFILIDALDECPSPRDERKLLLQSLQKLTTSQVKNFHLLVTSRDEPAIEAALKDIVTIPPLNIQSSDVDGDIRIHVQAQLQSHPIMSAWPRPVQKEVEDALTEKAGGMFRWVACQLESLQACQRASAVRKALQSLPRTLDETYERVLVGIRPESQQEAITALAWLVFSKRPMTVAELAEGSVIDITSSTIKPFETAERLFNPNSIVEILSGLISVTTVADGSNTIRLAHFSVEEYLVSERIQSGPASSFHLSYLPAVQSLAAGCLYYLLSPDLHGQSRPSLAEPPLLQYASSHWPSHAKDCERPTPEWLMDVIMKFFDSQESFQIWQASFSEYDVTGSDRGCSSLWGTGYVSRLEANLPPIYYACRLGQVDVVRKFLDHDLTGDDPNRAQPGRRPGLYADELRAACHFGHEEIVFMLLEAGADHAAVGGKFGTALGAAMNTESPSEPIVARLLEVGHQILPSEFLAGWLMRWAVGHGHLRVVKLMLGRVSGLDGSFSWTKTSPNGRFMSEYWSGNYFEGVRDQKFGPFQTEQQSYINHCSSPYQAIIHGQTQVFQALVRRWNNVNEQDYEGRTALYWATFLGDETSVRLLLQKGARPGIRVRGYGWEAIDWAMSRGQRTIRELLEEEKRKWPTELGYAGDSDLEDFDSLFDDLDL